MAESIYTKKKNKRRNREPAEERCFNPHDHSVQKLSSLYTEQRSDILFWFGAGASAQADLPTWNGLKDKLIAESYNALGNLPGSDAEALFQKLEDAKGEENNWKVFSVIEEILTRPKFIDIISDEIVKGSESAGDDVLDIYEKCWSMRVRGAVTLNVDPLCERAHRNVRRSEVLSPFHSRNCAEKFWYVSGMKPFILYAHGTHDAPSSWVFTEKDASAVSRDKDYRKLIDFIFQRFTVVFIGISATDAAAGGLLKASFPDRGIYLRPHYWITDKTDLKTQKAAAEAGINVIGYTRANGRTHESCVCEVLDFLQKYNSHEAPPKAIRSGVEPKEPADDVNEFIRKGLGDKDAMRSDLASYMEYVLDIVDGDVSSPLYQDFVRRYRDALKLCWEPDVGDVYMGYEISDHLGGKHNSTVYEGRRKDGSAVAIKIQKMDKWEHPLYGASFRRGVESSKILTKEGVQSVAPFVEAYEVPQMVISEKVLGWNIYDVVGAGSSVYEFWNDGIHIAIKIAKHLDSAHALDEGVLHRDLRPSNIILSKYYIPDEIDDKYECKLLNYDLSWHRYATGSVGLAETEFSAYHAPEQIEDINDAIARSTLVDSYGLGMVIWFLYMGKNPPILASMNDAWHVLLENSFRNSGKGIWKSADRRLSRLIRASTINDQKCRLSIGEILGELEFLRDANVLGYPVKRADCWAEELISRAGYDTYEWDERTFSASYGVQGTKFIGVRGNPHKNRVEVYFQTQVDHSVERSQIGKMLQKKVGRSTDILKSGGWKLDSRTGIKQGAAEVVMYMEVHDIVEDAEAVVRSFTSAANAIFSN